jgi:hypothetical protein
MMLYRAQETRVRTMREEVFPAPTRGWVQAGNLVSAPPDAAEVLDNFFVTAQGARLRGGAQAVIDLGAPVVRMFTYVSGSNEDFFGSTQTAIYDLTLGTLGAWSDGFSDGFGGGTQRYAMVEGLSSGDWSATQLGNASGQYVVIVNGEDPAMYWDGTEWNPINGTAINKVPFDAETAGFSVGETVTGGTSGASATILAVTKTSPTAGVLKVGAITSGPFQDNEALSSAGGAATAMGASASGSAIVITNVATDDLSHVNLHKRRLWFVEKNTTNAWYLPVDSIGGSAAKFDFGAVFREGGNLLFTATWSLDSGNGLDDVFIAVSTQGEIAVYEGTDPGSASTWSLTGVYKIGKPLNKHATFKAGGDLAILTEDGIVPVSEALRKDRAALQANAISATIEDAWKQAIANRTTNYPISAVLWQSQSLLIIGTPTTDAGRNVAFAAYAPTGAWSRIVGWDIRCAVVYNDQFYFGTNDGRVFRGDVGGRDGSAQYTATFVPKFSFSQVLRGAVTAGITYRANQEARVDLYAHADYVVDDMPSVAPTVTAGGATWGSGVWGEFVWGGDGNLNSYTQWQHVRASGYALAPAVKIASNQDALVDFEIVAMRLRSEQGYPL